MVAAFGLLEHFEILVECGLVLERGAVDALELRVFLVALVVGAGHGGELERADVARAQDVRPGAQVHEVAVPVVGNRLALGNVLEIADLELAGRGPVAQRRQPAFPGIGQRLLTGDDDLLEGLVRLDDGLHLGLDLRKVLGRDAVLEFDIVVIVVLDGWPRRELGGGPELDDGVGHDMGAGVAEALQVGHLVAVIEGFALRIWWRLLSFGFV